MSELFKTLSNISSLRAALRDISLEQAESLLEKLSAIVEEKREEIKQQEEERSEHGCRHRSSARGSSSQGEGGDRHYH